MPQCSFPPFYHTNSQLELVLKLTLKKRNHPERQQITIKSLSPTLSLLEAHEHSRAGPLRDNPYAIYKLCVLYTYCCLTPFFLLEPPTSKTTSKLHGERFATSTEGLLFVRVSTETQPECTDTREKRFCPPYSFSSPSLSFLLSGSSVSHSHSIQLFRDIRLKNKQSQQSFFI